MADCLPCSRGDCDECVHPTCTCDHVPPDLTFDPCPDAPHCTVPGCDGTDLGHDLAVDFPEETARIDAALNRMARLSRAGLPPFRPVEDVATVLDPDTTGEGRETSPQPSPVDNAKPGDPT